MDRKSWNVDVDGERHAVVLNWTYWSGHRQATVDGNVVSDSSRLMAGRSEQTFEIDGHPAVLRTEPATKLSSKFVVTLEVDAEIVEPEPGKSSWEA